MAFDFFSGTKTNLVDTGAQLAGNWFLTGKAAESPDLRWSWGDAPGKPSSPYRDYRFAMGLGGVAVNLLSKGTMSRIGHDVAAANLHSFVSTEQIRRQSLARLQQGGGEQPASQAAPPPQLAPPFQSANSAPAGGAFARFASFLPGSYQ